jgi:UDP-3-O-[3-hydroxymyristoyl] glucosamine N-acyltransferase
LQYTLGQLAEELGLRVEGDASHVIHRIATLAKADVDSISFLADSRYRKYLQGNKAGAVILRETDRPHFAGNALISDNPYLSYARLSALFTPVHGDEPLLHERAVIHPDAVLGSNVRIGANAVIAKGVQLADNVIIGPGSVIGEGSEVGKGSLIHANVSIYHDCHIGERAVIHSGAVIGSDGFGFANEKGEWVKIHQLGRVIIGNDVEIGANTSIDRGAIEDTVIGNGVKLDNQIQIAHNVSVGNHTAMAGCVGVAGSADIGANCAIGGGVGILGHLKIVDGVTITAMSLVPGSIKESGVYSAGTPLEPKAQWQKNYIRFKQLDDMARRIKTLEKALAEKTKEG